jgi:vancomycin resistance protein YoaR
MWFTGVDIITHTPHSFYFDRYPAGREATIDYPGVNLEFNNNSPYWILIDTAVTADSVTVTFWSTPYYQVEQSVGDRQPVPGQDFRVTYRRTSTAPPIPELGLEGFTDNDEFTKTYGIAP